MFTYSKPAATPVVYRAIIHGFELQTDFCGIMDSFEGTHNQVMNKITELDYVAGEENFMLQIFVNRIEIRDVP